ncbi:MAG TPA: glycerol-3-phosphate dehydrogenase/oxidase, partial [Gemmatimonadaceae bacterium]|nr:glycerol-3-phosphate dehydrogenase/oxidase [Gemmatimonadaceae bacterium]
MNTFATTPGKRLEALQHQAFDLLVIGGGITGCGIARDASLRGLSVALVEKDDFASGTSSRSSRLIHGGVRYLEHGHLHLVFESSAERRRLLRLAAHLVRPLAFTWPVYAGDRIPRWKLGAGLLAYDALALFRNVARHKRLDRDGVLAREPMLRHDGLLGGARYYDAATNDARLTLANALAAAESGATVVNHATVMTLLFHDGRVAGARVQDSLTEQSVEVRARIVVNATGPWSDDVRRLDAARTREHAPRSPAVRGSKGTHIAVPRERLGNRDALTLSSPLDGRVMFALPAGRCAIVGTTDGYTSAAADEVRATNEDVNYLLDSANSFFPSARLTTNDVVSAWAGIRPLLPTAADNPGSVSREHAVTTSDHGLISITGGKLTT